MQTYVAAELTTAEREILQRHFTSVDGPAAALVGLPEATKAALFARYSRSAKPLKRVFLDEFYDPDAPVAPSAETGAAQASDLFSRVLSDYGDDSVAQLAGVHVSCEQVSNLLTKIIERGRLMGYLEQSTRYVFYGDKPAGQYRYHRDPELLAGPHRERYVAAMDGLFDAYNHIYKTVRDRIRSGIDADDAAANRAALAAAKDMVRGLLPAGTISNVGIFGSPQAYEQLILRMRSDELPEARAYAELILGELIKVIPDFLTRLQRPDRGGVWVEYRRSRQAALQAAAARLDQDSQHQRPGSAITGGDGVRLLRWDDDAEDRIIAAALYSRSSRPLDQILSQVQSLPSEGKLELFRASVGDRRNRRHRPGREFEAAEYEFEIISDYGAFRDLQRHRLLTIDWQRLSPGLGYDIPDEVEDLGLGGNWRDATERAEDAYAAVLEAHPPQAQYLVTMAHRVRYLMRMNAREAMHLIELRSSPQGHPSYRAVAQAMHRLIGEDTSHGGAGHRLIAAAMEYINAEDVHLGRVEAERRLEQRIQAAVDGTGEGRAPTTG